MTLFGLQKRKVFRRVGATIVKRMGFELVLASFAVFVLRGVSATCGLQQVFPDLNFIPKPDNLVFPCESTKNIYLQTKRYDPMSILITRAQINQVSLLGCTPKFNNNFDLPLSECRLRMHTSPKAGRTLQLGQDHTKKRALRSLN